MLRASDNFFKAVHKPAKGNFDSKKVSIDEERPTLEMSAASKTTSIMPAPTAAQEKMKIEVNKGK